MKLPLSILCLPLVLLAAASLPAGPIPLTGSLVFETKATFPEFENVDNPPAESISSTTWSTPLAPISGGSSAEVTHAHPGIYKDTSSASGTGWWAADGLSGQVRLVIGHESQDLAAHGGYFTTTSSLAAFAYSFYAPQSYGVRWSYTVSGLPALDEQNTFSARAHAFAYDHAPTVTEILYPEFGSTFIGATLYPATLLATEQVGAGSYYGLALLGSATSATHVADFRSIELALNWELLSVPPTTGGGSDPAPVPDTGSSLALLLVGAAALLVPYRLRTRWAVSFA